MKADAPPTPATPETEAATATEEMTADTMLGDLVSALIDELKAAPDVWQKMGEHQQHATIDRITSRCTGLVKMAVNLIAADGRQVITAELEQITAKDGIKAVLTLPRHDEQRHALLDAVGKPVLIVVAGNSQFLGGALPQPDPQQPQLLDDAAPAADNTEPYVH